MTAPGRTPQQTAPTDPATAWPRRAVPLSAVGIVVGLVMVLAGLAAAGDRTSTVKGLTVAAAPVTAVIGAVALTWWVHRWLQGRLSTRFSVAVLLGVAVVAVPLVVLGRAGGLTPVSLSGLGGLLVGMLAANVAAVRRARRR